MISCIWRLSCRRDINIIWICIGGHCWGCCVRRYLWINIIIACCCSVLYSRLNMHLWFNMHLWLNMHLWFNMSNSLLIHCNITWWSLGLTIISRNLIRYIVLCCRNGWSYSWRAYANICFRNSWHINCVNLINWLDSWWLYCCWSTVRWVYTCIVCIVIWSRIINIWCSPCCCCICCYNLKFHQLIT